MKILITGGAGFIGSNFIHYWLKNHPDDQILNFDKLTYAGNLENLESVKNNPNYEFVKSDICDAKKVDEVIKNIDILVHFAAESHVDRSIMGPAVFLKTNILGTQVLLEAARKHKIKRFHHISTDEVFGALELEDKEKFNENSPFKPNSPYSASKAGSDCLVRSYFKTYGVPITITNTSNNYGPYQFPEKFIPLMITNALEDKKLPIYGDGLYVRDWLYVEDHCRAIETVLKRGKVGETYCVGGDAEKANIDVAKTILKILGKSESLITHVEDRPGHDRRYAIGSSKIKNKLGFKPLHNFDEWLEKTVDWYRNNQDWWKNIKTGEYLKYYEKQYNTH